MHCIRSNDRCRCAQFYLNTTCVWPQQHNYEENHSNSHCVSECVCASFVFQQIPKNIIRNVFAMKPPYACIRIRWEIVVSWLVGWLDGWTMDTVHTDCSAVWIDIAFTIHFYSSRWMIRTNVVLFDAKWIRVFSSLYSSGCVMLAHDIAHTLSRQNDATKRQNFQKWASWPCPQLHTQLNWR